MTTTDKPRTRRPKIAYKFHERRAGDKFRVKDEQARVYYMSAFANWKRGKPGTLKATSRKDGAAGYIIEFEGVSPAEATAAILAHRGEI